MKLFVSPHNDDAALFGAFTLQRELPTVLTVFDSFVQVERGHEECTAAARREEDSAAMAILGCSIVFGGIPDMLPAPNIDEILCRYGDASVIWLPLCDAHGHLQHNQVSIAGQRVFARWKIRYYLTYNCGGKSTNGRKVPHTGAMIRRKLLALACYRTQIENEALGCWPHFLRDQEEYLAC